MGENRKISEGNITREELLYKIQIALEQTNFSVSQQLIETYKKHWEYSDELAVLEGESLISTGQPDKALFCIEAGLACNSSNHELYFMLGEAYELLNNMVCAELCYRYSIYQCHEKNDLDFLLDNLSRFHTSFGSPLPKLSLVLRVNKNTSWLKLCLQVISLFTMPEHFEILFLKEFSSPVQDELIANQSLGTIIPYDAQNISACYNLAIEQAEKSSDFVIIDEGGLPLEHSLFTLQLALHQSHEVGAVGSISNHPSCSGYMKKTCPTVNDAMAYAHIYNVPNQSALVKTFDLPGPIYMFKRSFIKRYGWFDTEFTLGSYQIKDYLIRLIRSDKSVLLCPNSLSILTADCQLPTLGEETELFYKKNGINLSYSCFARKDLLSLISIPSADYSVPINVLEVGCACGSTLIELNRRFPNAALYGIETDEGAASIAAHFANISNENIENFSLNYPNDFFDYIIFGDVLEHLKEPGKVLDTVKTYLRKDGWILASIPNVMHISVLRPLLNGFWTYENAGILDRTHLKFFTYQEILRLFQDEGYLIKEISATTVPITEEDKKLISRLAELQNVPEQWFQAYQYLVLAQKRKGVIN
ncbi:class I SAM-dependent methyltransferase [Clostridium transplantifaecale]|uniref:class I SAM-dependent methyltransferase n=1 Tax=Clostridium transplantifaecale TaxID=2479838 RepID=UPI000F64063C|nr:class I SAM-dependent methyltransferase [Clostridium transplantifaecale]